MTEPWKGRKYRINSLGSSLEVLSEPFDCAGKSHVAYAFEGESYPHVCQVSDFESGPYTRIREPKFAKDDKVKTYGDVVTIIAVAAETDLDGDFGYLYKDSNGHVDILWEDDAEGKVSE